MIQRTLTLFSLWTATILPLELAGFTKSAHLQTLPLFFLSQVQINQADIATLTQQVTVVINGQNPGSGVIIGRQGNTYTVLTANHVVASPDEYQIVTVDGIQHPLNYTTVRRLPNLDLALVQFTSNQIYETAQMGDSDIAQPGTAVYIAGWPHPGIAITERIFQMTPGQISGRSQSGTESGYELVYTNITRSGMSGGPVLDTFGRLIGIHGRAEGQAIYNPDTGDTVDIKSGFNLGIPLDTFIKSIETIDSTVLSTNPSFAYPLSKQADRQLVGNQIQPAIAQYQRILAINPNYLPAVFGMGQAQYQLGETTAAIAEFRNAINLATAAIAQVQSNPSLSPQQQLLLVETTEIQGNAQVALASALYASGDQKTALSLIFELLKNPENWRGKLTLLEPKFPSSRLQTDAQVVAATAQEIVAQGVEYLPTEFNLAQALYERGEVQNALSTLESLFQENQQDPSRKMALAAVLNATGNRQRAETLISELQSEYAGQFRDENFEFLLTGLWSSRLREDVTKMLAYYRPSATLSTTVFSNTLLHPAEDSDLAYIEFLALSRDGKTLVSTNGEGTIKVWDIDKGTVRHTFPWTGNLRDAIALSPDGRLVALGIWDDTDNTPKVQLWDTQTGQNLRTFTQPGSNGVTAVAFSPDNQTLASSAQEILLWDVRTEEVLHTLPGKRPYSSYSLAFSPDGNRLASSSLEIIQLWNPSSGELMNEIELSGEHIINGLIFSSNSNLLLSRSDRGIQLWNPNTGNAISTVPQGQKYALSPDGQTLALCAGTEISLINVASNQVTRTLSAPSGCYQLVFLPNSKTLVSGGNGGKIEIWDLDRSAQLGRSLEIFLG